jgi:DNA-directed RNA polymerase subunit H
LKAKINLFDHELVPKHIVLSEDEKRKVMKMYGIKKLSQFPKIWKSDPIVSMIKAKPGDLIKIIRKNKTTKESVYYRVVIEV